MACEINGNTVRNGLRSFVDEELTNSLIFDKRGELFSAKPTQTFAANEFVNTLNQRFSEDVVSKMGTDYAIRIPDSLILQYVESTPAGQELSTTSSMYYDFALPPASWNRNTMFSGLNYPEIDEITYGNLVSFLKSINPRFDVQEVDNLPTEGVTQLKNFLIQVKTLSKFTALPEEVAHVIVELIPDNHPLKKDMLNNITSFKIYSDTLALYKDVYTLPDGRPDYDKIKREAAAKLVAAYITAEATDNFAAVNELTKTKQGWISRWIAKLIEWLGINMLNRTQSYADIAGMILSGDTDISLKTEKDIADISFTDSYFFRMSEEQIYLSAEELRAKRPPQLLSVISKFSKEFGRRFNDILKDDKLPVGEQKYTQLNEMLKTTGNQLGKINRLSEVKIILGEVDLDLDAVLDAEAYTISLKQFIEAVDRLDILSESILKVIKSKEKSKDFNEAIENIRELEGYFGIYETFNNIISGELAQVLIDSNVAQDVIESIQRTQLGFKNVNDHILSRLRNDLFIFYKTMLETSNNVAATTLAADIARLPDNEKAKTFFDKRMEKLIISDDDIIKMLSGRGRDIDNFSSLNHLINAAHTNGDVFIATIAKYIQDRIERQQVKAGVNVRTLYQQIDPIQKRLAEDAAATGKKITFIDTIFDRDSGETRQVLTWLNPHKNIQPALDTHRRAVEAARQKRADADKNSEAFKEADAEYKIAQKAYSDFLEKYMNRPFVREYYDFRKKYESDTDFITAMEEWKVYSADIKADEELVDVQPEQDAVWERIAINKRLRANLLNERDLNGDMKPEEDLKKVRILKQFFEEQSKFREEDEVQTERSFLIYKNRYDQKVDFAIAEARKQNIRNLEDLERELQRQLRDPRIRIGTAYTIQYPDYEVGNTIDYSFVKNILSERWARKNITFQRNEEFFEFEKLVRDELDALQAKGELSDEDIAIKVAYESIRGILFGSRDEIGHINPDSLTEEERQMVIDWENFIVEQKANKPGLGVDTSDMTEKDREDYDYYTSVLADDTLPDDIKKDALFARSGIQQRYKNVGRAKAIRDLIELLGSLTKKVPTVYYWDRMTTFLPHVAEFAKDIRNSGIEKAVIEGIDEFAKEFTEAVDNEDWDKLDFYLFEQSAFKAFLEWLRENRIEDLEWFLANHIEKTVFDHDNIGYTRIKYARIAVYNFSEPTLDAHKKIVYNRKFRKFRVKDEYRTGYNPATQKVELQVGTHITNREYNGFPEFMPLLPEQGAPTDSPYRNDAYYQLRDNDPDRFQYLTLLRDADLLHQEKTPSRIRRWNQVPVMDLSNVEQYFELENVKELAKEKYEYVKSIFKKDSRTGSDEQEAAAGEETAREIDQFTQTTITQRIPKLGMSQKIPIERVSRDLLKSTAQFIIRAHEFEGRVEAEPVVKSIVRVMKDNEFKNQMSNKERTKKFESIYSQMILQEVPETTLNTKAVRRIAKFLTANTGMRMLLDPIGGVINYGSAMVNNVIEATAGKYLNLGELAKGKVLAFRVNMHMAADFNKKANLSVDTLLFQTFDFLQGEFEEDLLDRSSSKDKKASVQQILMLPRKTGELMAQTAIGMGILERHKVKNEIDGKLYPVHEIYIKDETGNNLKLKDGFPKEYNPVDGEKFLKLKTLINRVNLELHGNYAKLSQSEASRYAIGKLAENMKRWFMPAFQRRFGRDTIDIVYEDLNEGYYRTGARAFRNVFGAMLHLDFGGAKDWMQVFLKTPRYRQNLARLGADLGQAFILFLIFTVLLGYSGDDKNEQLENNSWIHNTAILIALRMYSETTAYIPVPPFGFQEMKRNVTTPFSLPLDAISNFAAIAQLGLYQMLYWAGADSFEGQLYYQKDSGYWYSNKGDSKLLKYVLNSIGHSGYTINPDQYIKQFDNLQKRLK